MPNETCSCSRQRPLKKCKQPLDQIRRNLVVQQASTTADMRTYRRFLRTKDVMQRSPCLHCGKRALVSKLHQANAWNAAKRPHGLPQHLGSRICLRELGPRSIGRKRKLKHRKTHPTAPTIVAQSVEQAITPAQLLVAGQEAAPLSSPLLHAVIGEQTSAKQPATAAPKSATVNRKRRASSAPPAPQAPGAASASSERPATHSPPSSPEARRSKRLKVEPSAVHEPLATKQQKPAATALKVPSTIPEQKPQATVPEQPVAKDKPKSNLVLPGQSSTADLDRTSGDSKTTKPSKKDSDLNLATLRNWPTEIKPHKRGLQNPGMWCYRRSLLQCLIALPQFCNIATEQLDAAPKDNGVASALREFVLRYHNPNSDHAVARLDQAISDTKRHPQKGRSIWSNNSKLSPEDANLFMLFLLNSMEEGKSIDTKRLKACFQSQRLSSWKCDSCQATHNHHNPGEWALPLALPRGINGPQLSLERMLRDYFAAEDLKIRCEKCKSNKQRKRTSCLEHLPEVLILQFQLFSEDYRRGQMVKDRRKPGYPADLRLADYSAPGTERTSFSLAAVVYHEGDLSDGHYIARVLGSDGRIYQLDDADRPRVVSTWNSSLGHFTSYLLFYTRR